MSLCTQNAALQFAASTIEDGRAFSREMPRRHHERCLWLLARGRVPWPGYIPAALRARIIAAYGARP